jgi:ABC-type antimicrobial peptide transport system permease subunit
LVGGILGALGAYGLVAAFLHSGQGGGFFVILPVSPATVLLAMMVAGMVGLLSAAVPSYHASQVNIVDGLRHIG